MSTVISVEHLTKQYDLGVIGTGTLSRDLNRWWARLRGQPDPYTRIGQRDHFERIGETILALDDVSFTVQQGEALGIIGKNGAGKSTLLKILSRVTAPTSGVVKMKGRVGSLLEVGTGFHPELTGRENVYLNGAILGMRKEEVDRKFDEIVDFSGVEKFIDTPVKRYSSGMYVRLAFAVAAHLDPEILIVDEVLAVGDAEFQSKCLGKMGDVAGEGRTVLFVSHNMAAVKRLCKEGFLLNNGRIGVEGQMSEVIDDYLSIYNDGNSKIEWLEISQAPGNDTGRIQSISLFNEKGETSTRFNIFENYSIEVEYSVFKPNSIINVSVEIKNSDDLLIFATPSLNSLDWGGKPHQVGIYKSRAEIPGSLLNHGKYSISLLLVLNKQVVIANLPRVLSFEIYDTGGKREGYFGKWNGILRPNIKWETMNLVESNNNR